MRQQLVFFVTLVMLASCTVKKSGERDEVPGTISADVEHASGDSNAVSMESLFGKPAHEIKTIGILVYDGVNDLDVIGPRYVLAVEAVYNKALHTWIRKIDETTVYTGAVCTGVWILGATGLLEGKRASSNWYREEEFLEKFNAIPANERCTHDGKYWTSAGVTAGMDMSLAIMQEIYGSNYAQAVMLDMEYDPHPPLLGGTPERTKPAITRMMRTLYDGGIIPLIDSLEKQSEPNTIQ